MAGGPQLIVVLVIVLVLFRGSQLPNLARTLGRAQKEFRDGMGEGEGEGEGGAAPSGPSNQLPPPPAPPL
ncbi:MAG TPA: twin-arginine translocase TatA/TatE family subunit [Ilumatobacteraceae bacterium]|nr:twin-arginine translocase TatA/TatE family subunit [Ilumatobacteraceae bacterium]